VSPTGSPPRGGLPSAGGQRELPTQPPECPRELLERMGADVLAKVERRWASPPRELGPYLIWRAGEPTLLDGTYGRLYDPALKRSDAAHLVVWRRCFPDKRIPRRWTVDHACWVTLCQRADHLQGPVTRAENTRRRHQRRQTVSLRRPQQRRPCSASVTFFTGVDRPTVDQRTLNLEDLVDMLTTFEVLDDKRRRRYSTACAVMRCGGSDDPNGGPARTTDRVCRRAPGASRRASR